MAKKSIFKCDFPLIADQHFFKIEKIFPFFLVKKLVSRGLNIENFE